MRHVSHTEFPYSDQLFLQEVLFCLMRNGVCLIELQ